jgi:hypothetical protein
LEHKKKRFKSLDHDVAKSGAFTIEDESIRKQFEAEYSRTAPLYYRGQIPLQSGTIPSKPILLPAESWQAWKKTIPSTFREGLVLLPKIFSR